MSHDLNFGRRDFTVDFWFRPGQTASEVGLVDFRSGSAPALAILQTGTAIAVVVETDGIANGGSLSTNTWYHVAVTRSGTSTRLFIDGTQVGSTYTDTNDYFGGEPRIGAKSDGSNPFTGHIDEVRVRINEAAWTANFTPPTQEYGFTPSNEGAGTANGTSTATATGASISAGAGTAAGTGTATATGTGIAEAQGSASGAGTATAEGATLTVSEAAGTANGAGTASATGASFSSGAGTAAGSGTATATGASISAGDGTAAGAGTATATGQQIIFLRPDADSVDGSWTNELGSNVNLFASIDEVTVNDNDYVQSSDNPTNDIAKIRLSDPSSGITSPMRVLYRYKKDGTGTVGLTVRLVQGTTTIAEWVHTDISSTYVDGVQTLTGPQFASITDPNDLYIELEADAA